MTIPHIRPVKGSYWLSTASYKEIYEQEGKEARHLSRLIPRPFDRLCWCAILYDVVGKPPETKRARSMAEVGHERTTYDISALSCCHMFGDRSISLYAHPWQRSTTVPWASCPFPVLSSAYTSGKTPYSHVTFTRRPQMGFKLGLAVAPLVRQ